MVDAAHGNRDVADAPIDFFFRSDAGLIAEDLLGAALIRHEELLAIVGDIPAEALAQIQQPELCPQIHEAVAAGCARQTDDALHPRAQLHQGAKAFCAVGFEG